MQKNPAYSMSALAKGAGISRSFLYEVLSGKKNLSPEGASKIATRLKLSTLETDLFILLIQLETAQDPSFRESLLEKVRALDPSVKTYDVTLDVFRTISDWYHIALLQLTELKEFNLSPSSASKKLSITIAEADAAIDRLLRLGLLRKNQDGRYIKTSSRLLVQAKVPSDTVKKFHTQILNKAISAVATQRPEFRKGRSELIPLNPEILEEAELILDRAYEEIIALAGKSRTKTTVYALSSQFFNLTDERK